MMFNNDFLNMHDTKIELRPKNKEVIFLYHTSSSHSALSSLANFFKFLEVEGPAEKYFSMLGWSFDANYQV